MIPKVIHYCWFGGGPKPASVLRCIDSWRKYCPDYEIIEWNESNINISMNLYTMQAYEAKAWGFVPDYLRLWIIYHYGGIYLDTDVQIIRSFDDLLQHKAFAGFEAGDVKSGLYVALGLGFGAEAKSETLKKHMELYESMCFQNEDGTYNKLPSPTYTTNLFIDYGLNRFSDSIQMCGDFTVYPTDYFCPKRFDTGLTTLTPNSYSIHQFDASWYDDTQQKEKRKRWRREKKRIVMMQIDYWMHTPNRILMRILGEQRYARLKKLFGR